MWYSMLTLCIIQSNCTPVKHLKKASKSIDIQGHRGCRGLYPENTLLAFDHALSLGVNTLELDVVVNKDNELVVSHEPFFNHEISTGPDGLDITKDNEKDHNIYKLTQAEIEQYDVGLKPHSRFPDQIKIACTKPLLKDVIELAEAKNPNIKYNIEIKRKSEGDDIYHPTYDVFADLLDSLLSDYKLQDRAVIQCFDKETLQYLHKNKTSFPLVLLIENQRGFDTNIEELGFKPDVFSPYHLLVDEGLVSKCRAAKIQLIPWTVNDRKDIIEMLNYGVDGIISDYPDRVINIINEFKEDE